MEFVAGNQPTEPLQPGKQPFHGPAAFVAPGRSAVLAFAPNLAVGCNHLDSVFLFEMPVERETTAFEALKEQLGLTLKPVKAPLEVLVIDHVQQPSAN